MNSLRSASQIRHDLATAVEYQQKYSSRPSDDPLVKQMRSANDAEIEKLRAELHDALSGVLEVALDGAPVEDHRVTVPYLNRVLESIQSTYRAILRSLSEDKHLRRGEATLSVAGTGPGSFRVALAIPPTQLELLDDPMADRALGTIVTLLAAAQAGTSGEVGRQWAETQDETAVRSMIRLSASLASSRGTTRLRLTRTSGVEELVVVTSEAARDLAMSLAGQAGREVITVTGHLEMAQDRPPKVRIRTLDDDYVAAVSDEQLLDQVKSLLFDTVQATLVIDMRTSATTGSPDVDVELMDLEPAGARRTNLV
ncbi:MAG: hypothetical protein ACYDGN_12415 [Acidimicrobiales bacterium]